MAPQTLFVADRAEPDPARPGYARLDAYSLASRLSFFLWNAAPDDELLRAAGKGELDSEIGLAKAVDRMLASPRLETGMRAFFDDMLRFDDLVVLAKDPGIYPVFGAETIVDAREQTLRTLVDHLLVRNLRLPRPVHEPRYVHLAVPRSHLRRGGAARLDGLHQPSGQRARGAADPGQLPGRTRPPGTQFADAARQGGARVAALPDCAAPAAQRGFLAPRGRGLAPENRARAPRPAPHQPGVRRVSQDHRSDRARLRKLRRCGPVPRHRARRGDRCQRRRSTASNFDDLADLSQAGPRPPAAQPLPGQARLRLGDRGPHPADRQADAGLARRAVRGRWIPAGRPAADGGAEQRLRDGSAARALEETTP